MWQKLIQFLMRDLKEVRLLKIVLSKKNCLHCLVPLNSVLFKPCQFLMVHISTGRKFYVTYLQFAKFQSQQYFMSYRIS